jgi:hypothetical protein
MYTRLICPSDLREMDEYCDRIIHEKNEVNVKYWTCSSIQGGKCHYYECLPLPLPLPLPFDFISRLSTSSYFECSVSTPSSGFLTQT